MNHFDEPTTALFLLRVSAENNTLRVVVVGQGDPSRAAFSSLQSALTHIEQSLITLTACSQEERTFNGHTKLTARTSKTET